MTFIELVDNLSDYADQEGLDVIEVLNQITEHLIPGIEDDVPLIMFEFDEVH